VVSGAYISSYKHKNSNGDDGGRREVDEIIEMTSEFEKREGRRPRILVAKMGQVVMMDVR